MRATKSYLRCALTSQRNVIEAYSPVGCESISSTHVVCRTVSVSVVTALRKNINNVE